MSGVLLFCAIQLSGVTGSDLRARAFFDANNVKVGDPIVLTIDFLGTAEFTDLHSPKLSRFVDAKDWKVDDASAKTDTFRDARRLTYRVRPMREGVVWFPSLEFEYQAANGAQRLVRANAIPVHARAGAQVVVAGMEEDPNVLPQPPDLIPAFDFASPGLRLSPDERFAWQKACAHPTADSFATFGFPAAKLNEASCAIREGNWARAMGVYRRLEWSIGQTPEIEKGIVAALALKTDNPDVELPVVRQVLRPLLRYGWKGRVGIVLGGFAVLALLFWLFGRIIRAFACVAIAALIATTGSAETIETVTTNADGSVTHTRIERRGNFSFTSTSTTGGTMRRPTGGLGGSGMDPFEMFEGFDSFGANRRRTRRPVVNVSVRLTPDKPSVTIGEDFNLLLQVDQPHYIDFSDGVRLSIAERDGKLEQTGAPQVLSSIKSKNPTNVVRRFAFPMRATESFTNLHFSVEGDYVFASDHPFFRTATPYMSGQKTSPLVVRPLPAEGRPADFGGIVSEGSALFETCDILKVHTNDVVSISYRLRPKGYVPAAFLPKDVAFEWERRSDRSGRLVEIEYRRYFVADGSPKTPSFSVSYYDPRKKSYQTVTTAGTSLTYVPDGDL